MKRYCQMAESTLFNILKEFNIRMDDEDRDRGDQDRPSRRPPEDGDDFNFDLGGSPEGEDDLPDGLDDIDDEDGEFAGERKVDITDRLKKLLSRQSGDEDGLGDLDLDGGDDDDMGELSSMDDRGSDRRSSYDDDDLGDFSTGDLGGSDRPEASMRGSDRPERSRERDSFQPRERESRPRRGRNY